MKFYLMMIITLLLGCQQTSEQLLAENSNKKIIKHKIICQKSPPPPLKNTKKLKDMLIAKGKIDAALSDKEIDREVNRYIRKKNAAFNHCKK